MSHPAEEDVWDAACENKALPVQARVSLKGNRKQYDGARATLKRQTGLDFAFEFDPVAWLDLIKAKNEHPGPNELVNRLGEMLGGHCLTISTHLGDYCANRGKYNKDIVDEMLCARKIVLLPTDTPVSAPTHATMQVKDGALVVQISVAMWISVDDDVGYHALVSLLGGS